MDFVLFFVFELSGCFTSFAMTFEEILFLVLFERTSYTNSSTIFFMLLIKVPALNSPRSISFKRFSHLPVSSADFNNSLSIIFIKSIPVCVGKTSFFLRSIYFLLNKVSIILALVDGLPIPFSFINSRKSSSSTCFPAVSIARNKLASVKFLGGFVSFSKNEGSCFPFSPFTKEGKVSCSFKAFLVLLSSVSKTTLQPLLMISFPVVLKGTSAALPITDVFETSESG